MATEVDTLLKQLWMVISHLKQDQTEWLARQQWIYAKSRCSQIIETSQKQRLAIGVVASTRTGKSSLINALLGISVLPTEELAASMRLITVHYTPRRKGSKLKLLEVSGKTSTGLEGVRQRLTELLASSSAEDWQMESPLEMNAAFCKALESETSTGGGVAAAAVNPNPVKLDLTELPSLSASSHNEFLKQKIQSDLEWMDGVFFLVDLLKLRTSEETEIVDELKEVMAFHSPRCVFVLVVKADRFGVAEDIDVEDTRDYTCVLLQKHGFNINPTQVFVISPKLGLLSRLIIADKNDAEIHQQFGEMIWGREADSITDKALWKSKANEILELSGIGQFEEQVLEFLHRNSTLLKQLSLLDVSLKTIEDLVESGYLFKNTLSRNLNETRSSIERFKRDKEHSESRLQSIKSNLIRLEQDVVCKVNTTLTKLKNALLSRIGLALSWNGVEDKTLKDLPSGWLSIRQDFLALINHQEMDAQHGEELLKELHEEVTSQIQAEMETTWRIVETMVKEYHFEQVLHTNEELDRLSNFWEEVTSKDLNVQIEPADVKLKPLNHNSLSQKLQDLLKIGMTKQPVVRSWFAQYLLGAQTHVFTFDGGSIREYFEDLIRTVIDETLAALGLLMRRHLSGQIATSEEKLSIFSEMYNSGVDTMIEERTSQIATSAISMKKVIGDLNNLKKMKNRIVELKQEIESGLILGDLVLGQDSSSSSSGVANVKQEAASPRLRPLGDEKLPPLSPVQEKGKYIPPRSRPLAPQEPTASPRLVGLSPSTRAISLPSTELAEMAAMESPGGGGEITEESDRSKILRSTSWNASSNNNWAAAPPVQRSVHHHSGNASPSHSGNFSPRSNFFRGFDKASQSKRGRGNEHRRRDSWT
eukprot:g68.t1